MRYAEVILPLPLYSTFTYGIPDCLKNSVQIGCRVLVPFGKKKIYTGIISLLHNNRPGDFEVKDIISILDNYPILRHPQLKFWEWIANYYLCSIGDVYKAAIPAGMKVESETFVSANTEFVDTDNSMKEREKIIYNLLLTKDKLSPSEISKATGFKNVESTVTSMIENEALYITEKIIDNYRPKTEVFVKLKAERGDNNTVKSFFDKVKTAKKQEAMLLAYLELSKWLGSDELLEVSKQQLKDKADGSTPILNAMVEKGIFHLYKKEINRFKLSDRIKKEAPKNLTDIQEKTYQEISHQFENKSIVLLHGVTSSGKTEIYTRLIQNELDNRRQVLYLVPEIALTTQLTQRLQKVFGDRLLIYHSKFSDNERVDIWKKLLHTTDPYIIIGVRSSIFLPFNKLGLIIVDEEHETSYKQQDPAPRYNARDAALVLASMHKAKTLLGSATPSISSYYYAKTGKYGLVELLTRHEGIEMPEVKTIDTIKARKKKEMRGVFSQELLEECNKAIERGEQVILFQNRRGFSPMVRCKECAWTPKCRDCDVTLTYHKRQNQLICHYCGYILPLPDICPACGQPTIEIIGYGTERIEDEIENYFPNAKVARMDLDTTRSKSSYENLIDDFSSHKTQVLVGTQMVTKGLDFDGVSIVGILNADNMINFPDFRSHERAFNMMEQVAGRAGRKHKRGTVYIQTSEPTHPIIKYVTNHDYKNYFNEELDQRRKFNYPPFTRIINIYIKHRNDDSLTEISVRFSNMLRQVFGKRVLGPEAPSIARIQQYYIRQITLKMETAASMPKVKQILRSIYEQSLDDPRMKQAVIYYDVDPM